jgi:hypothetical protein
MFKIVHNTSTRSDAKGLARVWGPEAPGGERWVEVAWYATDPYRGPFSGRPIGRQVAHPLEHWVGRDWQGDTWVAVDATEAEAFGVARW